MLQICDGTLNPLAFAFTFAPIGIGTDSFVAFAFTFILVFIFAFTHMEASECIYILFNFSLAAFAYRTLHIRNLSLRQTPPFLPISILYCGSIIHI